jgi:hypothetical protein
MISIKADNLPNRSGELGTIWSRSRSWALSKTVWNRRSENVQTECPINNNPPPPPPWPRSRCLLWPDVWTGIEVFRFGSYRREAFTINMKVWRKKQCEGVLSERAACCDLQGQVTSELVGLQSCGRHCLGCQLLSWDLSPYETFLSCLKLDSIERHRRSLILIR